jgi:hypothetical protein
VHVWSEPTDVARPRPAQRGHALLLRNLLLAAKVAQPAAAIRAAVADWLGDQPSGLRRVEVGLAALELADGMPAASKRLSRDGWWALLDWLLETAHFKGPQPAAEHALVWQLEAGELPLLLACRLPERAACHDLATAAMATLVDGLEQLLDGEGLPHAALIPSFRPLLACWTRSRALMESQPAFRWGANTQEAFEWAVRQNLALSRPDGAALLSDFGASSDLTLLRSALALDGEAEHHQMAERLFVEPARKVSARGARAKKATQPPLSLPAIYSEWSSAAIMAPAWSRHSRLALTYSGRQLLMELALGTESVWRGEWSFEVQLNGSICEPTADYEEVCWTSDDEVDYLELEIQLAGGVRLERQMLLARKDGLLLLADAIIAEEPAAIQYQSCLPLTARYLPEADTHDGLLLGRRRLARVLPLALPEWRSEARRPFGRSGALEQVAGGLQLRQQATEARAMLAPLLFDLDPKRTVREATWRQLTVAETREIQPPDIAVGYRAQFGRDHWLMYRSLAPVGNRTLVGHNLVSEFMVGRFDSQGVVDPLLEIE